MKRLLRFSIKYQESSDILAHFRFFKQFQKFMVKTNFEYMLRNTRRHIVITYKIKRNKRKGILGISGIGDLLLKF